MRRILRITFITIFSSLLIGLSPAISQTEQAPEATDTQSWIIGIQAPTLDYRSWTESLTAPDAPPKENSGIDAAVDAIMSPINALLYNAVFYSVPFFGTELKLVVAWLVVGAIFCTFYFGFINFRGIPQAFRLIRGDFSDPNDHGEVSHFQALATALSGTVGAGFGALFFIDKIHSKTVY